MHLSFVLLFLLPYLTLSTPALVLPDDAASLPISQLLTLASSALSQGQSQYALDIYDHVLARDPTDFATLYKRATIRLSLGQLARAKEGFEEVLKVKEFEGARIQLVKIHAKLGEFAEATEALKKLDHKSPVGAELVHSIRVAAIDLNIARQAINAKPPNHAQCIASTTAALVVAPNSEELRLLRAECHMQRAEWDATVGDLSRAAALAPNLAPYLLVRLSLVSSLFLDHGLAIPAESWASLKRCIAGDPESKPCRGGLKNLKKLEKELAKLRNWIASNRWTEANVILSGRGAEEGLIEQVRKVISEYQQRLPTSPDQPAPLPTFATPLERASPLIDGLLSTLCHAHIMSNQMKKSEKSCEEILSRKGDDLWGLVGRGEKLIVEEDFEEAVRVLNSAFEQSGRSDRDILARLQKAQRLLKQSTMKDYYKVLAVARDADGKTIKKAYRKATLKAHPDKGGSESAMQAVNEAYEVLSKPELRARFDAGDDPNDAAAQQQQHHHHHHQGAQFHQFFQQQQQQQGSFFGQQGFKVNFG